MTNTIFGVDPRTGTPLAPVAEATDRDAVAALVDAAREAAPLLAGLDRDRRAQLLEAIADGIAGRGTELIETAAAETGFADAKLSGEINRAAYQFRFFAEVLRDGGYLEATLDSAAETPMGPRPDLRRLLVPIGPVAVFGASNFPFAFSVLGGDTASALAAGSPVIVKAHGSHPGTSALSADILREAVEAAGLPTGVIGIVFGTQAGADLVAHPDVKAVGFTGSLSGGKALLDIINHREEPIPFYGELSSLNPVIVTPQAAADRGADIGAGLVASFTIGAGQLCTKPGMVLVPEGADGDALVTAASDAISSTPAQVLLNERIHNTYDEETTKLLDRSDLRAVTGDAAPEHGFSATPMFFETTAHQIDRELIGEIFGPVTVIVRYNPAHLADAVSDAVDVLPASLTATVHSADTEGDLVSDITRRVADHAGRIVYDGFPTGVAVSWAQTHGGPWPSTNSLHTSVGATAIRRFLRPLTFQNAPAGVLPIELTDDYAQIPRRVDGVLVVPVSDTH